MHLVSEASLRTWWNITGFRSVGSLNLMLRVPCTRAKGTHVSGQTWKFNRGTSTSPEQELQWWPSFASCTLNIAFTRGMLHEVSLLTNNSLSSTFWHRVTTHRLSSQCCWRSSHLVKKTILVLCDEGVPYLIPDSCSPVCISKTGRCVSDRFHDLGGSLNGAASRHLVVHLCASWLWVCSRFQKLSYLRATRRALCQGGKESMENGKKNSYVIEPFTGLTEKENTVFRSCTLISAK